MMLTVIAEYEANFAVRVKIDFEITAYCKRTVVSNLMPFTGKDKSFEFDKKEWSTRFQRSLWI